MRLSPLTRRNGPKKKHPAPRRHPADSGGRDAGKKGTARANSEKRYLASLIRHKGSPGIKNIAPSTGGRGMGGGGDFLGSRVGGERGVPFGWKKHRQGEASVSASKENRGNHSKGGPYGASGSSCSGTPDKGSPREGCLRGNGSMHKEGT